MSGRPRRADVEARVADAVLAILAAHGYGAATMDAIAERASVGKPALYRRYESRAELVAAAFELVLARTNPEPGTGDVALELRRALENIVHLVERTPFGKALAAVVGELAHEPALAAAARKVDERRRKLLAALLVRARCEKRLRAGWTVEQAIDVLLGAVYFRAWVRRLTTGRAAVQRLVDRVVSRPG